MNKKGLRSKDVNTSKTHQIWSVKQTKCEIFYKDHVSLVDLMPGEH